MTSEPSRRLKAQINRANGEVIRLRQVVDHLKTEIEAREFVIDKLNVLIERAYRKISHGCIDANCKECDE